MCSAGMGKGQELLLCFRSVCVGEAATWPRVSTARLPTSLTAAGFVAGALSQAQKDIARLRRIFMIGTVALGTIRLQR